MASRNRGPVAPVRAIFHDVLPAQKRDVPGWMKKAGAIPASSLPPTSAAALLHGTRDPSAANDGPQPYHPAPLAASVDVQQSVTTTDPLLDARIQSASLADEASESWIPPQEHEDATPALEEAVTALRAAIVDLNRSKTQILRDLEPQLLSLTRLIAERVLEAQLPSDNELPHRLVQEGLNSLDHNGLVTITLGPGFSAHVPSLKQDLENDGVQCEIHVRDHLALYACQIRTELGVVDETVETRLDLILASLLDSEDIE